MKFCGGKSTLDLFEFGIILGYKLSRISHAKEMRDACGKVYSNFLLGNRSKREVYYRFKARHGYTFDLFVLNDIFAPVRSFLRFPSHFNTLMSRLYLRLELLELDKRKRKQAKSPIKDLRCMRYIYVYIFIYLYNYIT